MSIEPLTSAPFTPPSRLGPYRRDDYVALPDERRCQLIFGRFYVSPSPSLLHQIVVTALWRRLDEIAEQHGGLAAVGPLDVALAEHSVLQPDVIYVSPERTAILEERVEGAPDLAIEVLSPSTARLDRGDKLRLYAASGVREFWLVDPHARQIEFLVNRDGRFVVAVPLDDAYQSEVLAQVGLDIASLWADVDRRTG